MRHRAIHASTSVGHTTARVGQTETWLVAAGSREVQEQGGVARLRVDLPEVDRSGFEKIKSKNFEKGVKPRLGAAGGV